LGWRRSGQGKGKNKNCLELGFTFFGNPLHDYKTYRNLRTIH
jgi:hypothetical protein